MAELKRASLVRKIQGCLENLANHLKVNASQHLYDECRHLETFIAVIFETIYGWELENASVLFAPQQRRTGVGRLRDAPAVDLVSMGDRLGIQVTTENRPDKITDVHRKAIEHGLQGRLERIIIVFFCTSKAPSEPASGKFQRCPEIKWEYWGIPEILVDLNHKKSIRKLEEIYEVIRNETASAEEGIRQDRIHLPQRSLGAAFLGRKKEIVQLNALLEISSAVVIHGMPGIGKTRLVIEYCHRNRRRFSSIYWIDARSLQDVEARLSVPYGDSGSGGGYGVPRVPVSLAQKLQSRDDWLLVIDGMNVTPAFEGFLDRCTALSQGSIVITSARSYSGRGVIADMYLGVIASRHAAKYLLDSTAPRGGDDQTARWKTGRDGEDAAGLALELKGYPLALEIAGAVIRTRGLSFGMLLRELRLEATSALVKASSVSHPEGLEGVLQGALGCLSPEAFRVLQELSWLHDTPFPLFALESSSGKSPETQLLELHRYCLIRRTPVKDSASDLARAMVVQPFISDFVRREMGSRMQIITLRAMMHRLIFAAECLDSTLLDDALARALLAHASALAEHAKKRKLLDTADWLTRHVIASGGWPEIPGAGSSRRRRSLY